MAKYMSVLCKTEKKFATHGMTEHNSFYRKQRNNVIQEIKVGKPVDAFIVDKNHPGGYEIHVITDNAIILIYNNMTRRLITRLIARPAQIERYYKALNKECPEDICLIAKEHLNQGLNNDNGRRRKEYNNVR